MGSAIVQIFKGDSKFFECGKGVILRVGGGGGGAEVGGKLWIRECSDLVCVKIPSYP